MSDHDLTLALRALGRRLDAEPVADVVPVVLARIAEPEPARRRRVRPLVLAFVVLLVLAATAVAASDRLRDWLRGSSVKIERVETLPPTVSTAATPPGSTASFAALGLGTPVDADAAAAALGAPLPASAELGPPAAIYRAATPDGDAITLAWTPADPVLLTVVPAHDENDPFLIGKSLTAATSIDYLTLPDGRRGPLHLRRPARGDAVRRPRGAVPARAGRAAVAAAGRSGLPARGLVRPGPRTSAGRLVRHGALALAPRMRYIARADAHRRRSPRPVRPGHLPR